MTTAASRRQKSKTNRLVHHLLQIDKADSTAARLRKACLLLVAEAIRARKTAEVLDTVIDLVHRLQERLPLPDPHPKSLTYEALRGRLLAQGTTPDRRDAE